MKTIRFGDLVRNSGRPKTLTLWTSPHRHKELKAAIRDNRILTVHHENVGDKRDRGEVGFRQFRDALYLIFPRRLPAQAPQSVVGINYELLEDQSPPEAQRLEAARPALVPLGDRPAAKTPPARPRQNKRFRVVVRATADQEIEVEAGTAREARSRALELARQSVIPARDFRHAIKHVATQR
jgi:hypothetical protein